jgi:hypothetical protein
MMMNKVLTLDRQHVVFQCQNLSAPADQPIGRLDKDPRTGLQKFFDGVKRLFDRVLIALPVNVRIFTGPRVSESNPGKVTFQLSTFYSRLSRAKKEVELIKLSDEVRQFAIKNPEAQLKSAKLLGAVSQKLQSLLGYQYIPPALDGTHNGFF